MLTNSDLCARCRWIRVFTHSPNGTLGAVRDWFPSERAPLFCGLRCLTQNTEYRTARKTPVGTLYGFTPLAQRQRREVREG